MGQKKQNFIVIVDDSEMDAFLLSHVLKSMDPSKQIKCFDNPVLAIEFFRDTLNKELDMPDWLFLDLNMPAMSGFEFLGALNELNRQHPFKCKVVIVSSSDAEEDIKNSSEFPLVVKYLVKPVSKLDFMDI